LPFIAFVDGLIFGDPRRGIKESASVAPVGFNLFVLQHT
jgi:hypothetical protein